MRAIHGVFLLALSMALWASQASAQGAAKTMKEGRAHGAAICVAQGERCPAARYAQAGDACACTGTFGGAKKRGRVVWK